MDLKGLGEWENSYQAKLSATFHDRNYFLVIYTLAQTV